MKAVEELTETDVPQLINKKRFDTIKQLIDLRVQGQQSIISSCLIQHLSVLDFKEDELDLVHYLYSRLNHADISSLDFNFIVQYACKK